MVNRALSPAKTTSPVSASDKGSTNYTVHVELADLDDGLRWGMTASISK